MSEKQTDDCTQCNGLGTICIGCNRAPDECECADDQMPCACDMCGGSGRAVLQSEGK